MLVMSDRYASIAEPALSATASETLLRPQISAAGTKVSSHYFFSKHWRNIMISKCLAIAFLATASMTGGDGANSHKPSGFDSQC
jgi:hypothetical protein